MASESEGSPVTTSSDVWACAACRSINNKRAGRCYRCYTPRAAAAMALADVPVVGALPAVPVLNPYRGSGLRAWLVTGALVALAIILGAYWWHAHDALGTTDHDGALTGYIITLFAAVAATLFAYATWISRVVDNLPALGLGYSRVTPRTAFFETLILGRNILTLRGRMVEVLDKVDPAGRGTSMVAAASIALMGPPIAAVVVWRVNIFLPLHERTTNLANVALAGFGVQMVGFALAIALIWRVERRCRALHRAMAAEAPVVTPAQWTIGQTSAMAMGGTRSTDRA